MAPNVLKPSERFKKLMKFFYAAAEFCGANVLREDYRMNGLTWGLIILINSYYICTVYTIYEGVVIRADYTVILESLCLCGSAVQGYVKLLNAIHKAKFYRFVQSEIHCLYEQFEDKTDQFYMMELLSSLRLCRRIVITLWTIYFTATLFIISIPLYYRLVLQEHIFVMQYIIPGIDPTTNRGYIIHNIAHVSCICFGAFGNFANDVLLFFMVAHIPLMNNFLKRKFDELDEVVKESKPESQKTKDCLKDLFKWHQRYIIFRETSKKMFYWVIFVQICTTTINIISTIVCIFLGTWPSGIFFLIYSFCILYTYCGLGNLVDIANESITTAIYDSQWYELSVQQQRMLLVMLRDSQEAKTLSIGGIAPLTLNTALKLTKNINTVAMILHEFLRKN